MTRTPTDRGVAFVKDQADGTHLVYVALGVASDGSPQEVFAVHRTTAGVSLSIDPAVAMVSKGGLRHTSEPVSVFGEGDSVKVVPTARGLGTLLA
ncbi:hypothetical protein [Streptomyces beijiangensis]|uniref:Uncharacterized protein n=1 Tax=Streptomyces beijiangensis TaxID=163361 RepID=A0A939F5X3_9ACTN|nr:hypothetical protein [Streptomyces beijiangensis]MBO0512243.1 hypothetical protein [Streptomyces beijiangensis]